MLIPNLFFLKSVNNFGACAKHVMCPEEEQISGDFNFHMNDLSDNDTKKKNYLKRLVFLITFLAPLVYRAMPKTLGSSLMISLFSVVLAFHDQLYYAKN